MSILVTEFNNVTEEIKPVPDTRLRSVFNAGKSIEVNNVTVSFKTNNDTIRR